RDREGRRNVGPRRRRSGVAGLVVREDDLVRRREGLEERVVRVPRHADGRLARVVRTLQGIGRNVRVEDRVTMTEARRLGSGDQQEGRQGGQEPSHGRRRPAFSGKRLWCGDVLPSAAATARPATVSLIYEP